MVAEMAGAKVINANIWDIGAAVVLAALNNGRVRVQRFQQRLVHFGAEGDDAADLGGLPDFVQSRRCGLGDNLRQNQDMKPAGMCGRTDAL